MEERLKMIGNTCGEDFDEMQHVHKNVNIEKVLQFHAHLTKHKAFDDILRKK